MSTIVTAAEIYLNGPNVLYVSICQDPSTLFPGSGFIEEVVLRADKDII